MSLQGIKGEFTLFLVWFFISCQQDTVQYQQYTPQQDFSNWANNPILNNDSIQALIPKCLKETQVSDLCHNVIYRDNQGLFAKQILEQIKDSSDFHVSLAIFTAGKGRILLPSSLAQHPSDIVRQYYASYLRLGISPESLQILHQMQSQETNAYIVQTIHMSIDILERKKKAWRFTNKTIDSLNHNYSILVYNNNPDTNNLYWGLKVDSLGKAPMSQQIIKPTLSFDINLPHTPHQPNFMYTTDNEYFHVGEDITWDWQGAPVHAISRSKVRLISYDSSWGVFVVFESIINKQAYTYYYGHLRNELLVEVGDIVEAGQVIGFIGEATSIENGGYRAHIHLGIEAAAFVDAEIGGYEFEKKFWVAPKEFLEQIIIEPHQE